YALRYEKPGEFPEDWPGFAMYDYQDCRRAETFTVYRASKAKDRQHCIGAEYNGFEFHDYVYCQNPKFYKKYSQNPPYQYETDSEREIFLKKDSVLPPKFEPLQFPEFSTDNLRANTPHIS